MINYLKNVKNKALLSLVWYHDKVNMEFTRERYNLLQYF